MSGVTSFLINLITLGRRNPEPAHPTTRFHNKCGHNIELDENNSVAIRREGYNDGIVFSQKPIPANQTVSIQILDAGTKYVGALSIGFTSLNPARIPEANRNTEKIRDWSERREVMWMRGLHLQDLKQHSVLSFYADTNGNVKFSMDGSPQEKIFQVKHYNKPLWAVFDICGKFASAKLVDVAVEIAPAETPDPESDILLAFQEPDPDVPEDVTLSNSSNTSPATVTDMSTKSTLFHECGCRCNECIMCMNDKADTVFIQCGHICMCFDCASDYVSRENGKLCPVCRAPIFSFQKIFL